MRMTDLVSTEEWQKLEEELNRDWGVNACAYDEQGFSVTGYRNFSNPLCPEIKDSPGGLQAICSLAHQFVARQCEQSGDTVIDQCDAGLLKVCAPIFVDDELVGILGACGCIPEDGEVETFMVEKSAGIAEERAEALAADIPQVTDEQAERLARFLEERVAEIVGRQRPK